MRSFALTLVAITHKITIQMMPLLKEKHKLHPMGRLHGHCLRRCHHDATFYLQIMNAQLGGRGCVLPDLFLLLISTEFVKHLSFLVIFNVICELSYLLLTNND